MARISLHGSESIDTKMKLQNNTVLITGGTSGIGLAFAEELHARGNTVIICGRREDRLKDLGRRLPGLITRRCDISDSHERQALAEWIEMEYPSLNVLFNNAGTQLAVDLTGPVDERNLRSEIDTNLLAPIHLASLLTPLLAKQEHAVIINITSGLAFAPLAFMPVYCATKAAMHSYTMSLRYQLRDTSISVFEVIPPSVDTELGHQRRSDPNESHGGLPVADFLREAMEALENDVLEAPIAQAKHLRTQGEAMFARMNP